MRNVELVLRRLAGAYPEAGCALRWRTPWELLVATILSAQCTDARVNLVTMGLLPASADSTDSLVPKDCSTHNVRL